MISSLKYNLLCYARYLGIAVAMSFAFIPYALLIGSSGEEAVWMSYQIECIILLIMFSFLYACNHNIQSFRVALTFGATRRGWFWAEQIAHIVYSVVQALVAVLVCLPVARFVYGMPVQVNTAILPLLVAAAVFCGVLGSVLGYVASRFGTKFMVIGLVAFIILLLVGLVVGFAFFFNGFEEMILYFMGLPTIILLLALCPPLMAAGWVLVRKASA